MIGYKAFEEDLTCRGFQYEIGKTYHYDGEIKICRKGFHFCKNISDCYRFYDMSDNTRICKVLSGDNVVSDEENIKFCTDEITIIEEITGFEKKVNSNETSTGYLNTGDFNAGNGNTGSRNTGHGNTGNYNAGDFNTGNMNTGNMNTGYRNAGDQNAGDYNTGHGNTGNYNTGNLNTGDWNTADYSCGCFCTKEQEMPLFDKPSGMTMAEFVRSEAFHILSEMPTTYTNVEYSDSENKYVGVKIEADRQSWYDWLTDDKKKLIKSMKNFDAEKFYECTGIRV